jgi:predicted nucleotidyltransferase
MPATAGMSASSVSGYSPGTAARSQPFALCYDVAVMPSIEPNVREALARVVAATSGTRFLVLHGSRGRGDAHAGSDWDFAYEADGPFDPDGLLAALADLLKADRIDLVDLGGAGALLRHRVARDGVVIFERTPGLFECFRLDAIQHWCDLAPVLEPLYEQVLEDIPR